MFTSLKVGRHGGAGSVVSTQPLKEGSKFESLPILTCNLEENEEINPN